MTAVVGADERAAALERAEEAVPTDERAEEFVKPVTEDAEDPVDLNAAEDELAAGLEQV